MQKYNIVRPIVGSKVDFRVGHAGKRRGGDSSALLSCGILGDYSFCNHSDRQKQWKLLKYVGFMRSLFPQLGLQRRIYELPWYPTLPIPTWRLHGVPRRPRVRHPRRQVCKYLAPNYCERCDLSGKLCLPVRPAAAQSQSSSLSSQFPTAGASCMREGDVCLRGMLRRRDVNLHRCPLGGPTPGGL